MGSKLKFTKVENPIELVPVLQSRHPHSCFILNQVQKHEGFKESLVFYIVGSEITESTWIVTDNTRRDYGAYVSISAPNAIVNGTEEICQDIKEVFSDGAPVLNWDTGMVFVSLEKPVYQMISDISVHTYGNITEAHPCNLYYMEIPEALQLEITHAPSVEVRKLDPEKQEEKFIVSNWIYARDGSEQDTRQSIQANASGGVFIDGKCVSGVCTPGYGLLSALYTDKEHRNKGYGKLTMRYAFRESAKQNCVPCLTVEVRNMRSVKFHEALGAKLLSVVTWIDIKKLVVD